MQAEPITEQQLQDELAERKEAEALLNDQRRVLELVASGAPLSESLNMLVRLIEAHAPGMLGSILLLDEAGVHLHHGASPSLPLAYSAAIDGVSIGPSVGSCGTAAFCKEAVYVEDIASDPLWSEFKAVALPHGLRACWSTPVFDAQRRVLGTFAMYYRQPGLPQAYHRRLIEITTHITAIAIGRQRMENDLRRLTLFQRTVLDSVAYGIISTAPDGVVSSFNPAAERLLGYTADEVVGQQTPVYWHDPQEVAQRARQLSEQLGETILPGFDVFAARPRRNFSDENEWTFIRKDGTRVPALLSVTALRGERGQIMGFVGLTYDLTERKRAEAALRLQTLKLEQEVAERQMAQDELKKLNEKLEQRVQERTAELSEKNTELQQTQSRLMSSAHQAGMAEIATNVLHNVGNVLNSVNVSAGLVSARLRTSKVKGLARAVRLLDEHAAELGEFLTHDARGQLLPTYLRELAQALEAEHAALAEELSVLGKSIEHLKEIVATQQSYAGTSRVVELVKLGELVDDALRINAESLLRHQVQVVKNLAELPALALDRNRLLQILVNLIGNARQAMDGVSERSPCITLVATLSDAQVLRITVADNGEGIMAENLTRVFAHGFTTRQNGHGFGLHSCVLAAQEMGGSLSAHSDGAGQGATFTLEIPISAAEGLR